MFCLHALPYCGKKESGEHQQKGVFTMSTQDNKLIVRSEFEEIWNQGKLDLIGRYFSVDFINFGHPCPLDRVRQIFEAWRTALPDLHYTVDAQIAEGDQVLSHCTLSGTHLGPFVLLHLWSLPPTGKHFSVKQMHLVRLRGGQIVEHWAVREDLGMLQQLGVIPAPVHG
jgi:predicted ester cyclase